MQDKIHRKLAPWETSAWGRCFPGGNSRKPRPVFSHFFAGSFLFFQLFPKIRFPFSGKIKGGKTDSQERRQTDSSGTVFRSGLEKGLKEMHENLKIAGIVCCLTAALLFNARLSIALDSTFAEKYGANGIAGGPAEGWTSGREGTVHAKTGKTPQPYSPRTSVNLPFYEKKLAEHDARIARNPDDATLYINKAIFQRMNLDVIGKVRTLERALKRKNLVTEGSELEDIHFDLAILYGPLGVYEKVYYHLRALHQIDRDYFLKAENGLEKYSGLIENSSP